MVLISIALLTMACWFIITRFIDTYSMRKRNWPTEMCTANHYSQQRITVKSCDWPLSSQFLDTMNTLIHLKLADQLWRQLSHCHSATNPQFISVVTDMQWPVAGGFQLIILETALFCLNKWVTLHLLLKTMDLPALGICNNRAESTFAPSQWETALLCYDVSHWLDASLESALNFMLQSRSFDNWDIRILSTVGIN